MAKKVVAPVVDVDQEARRKERQRARRAAQRGSTEGSIRCELCAREGKIYMANSLVTHLRIVHQMDSTDYDLALGLAIGQATIVSAGLKAVYAAAGRRGAIALKERREAEAELTSGVDEDQD